MALRSNLVNVADSGGSVKTTVAPTKKNTVAIPDSVQRQMDAYARNNDVYVPTANTREESSREYYANMFAPGTPNAYKQESANRVNAADNQISILPLDNGGNSGGSTGGSSSSGGGSGSTAPVNNAYDDLQSYLDSIYAAQEAQRQREYQNTLGQLRNARDQGANALNQNADNALRQAYVNYMMGRRNVNQALSNAGLTGGATESTIADLYNNYGDNRAAIERERMNGLSNLDLTYNQGVADAGMAYGSDYTDLLTNYMQNMYGLRENYANDLAKALGNANAQRYSGGNGGSNEGSEGNNANVDYQTLVSMLGQNLNANNQTANAPTNVITETPTAPVASTPYRYNHDNGTINMIKQQMSQLSPNAPDTVVAQRMQALANRYNLTTDEARNILRELGY